MEGLGKAQWSTPTIVLMFLANTIHETTPIPTVEEGGRLVLS